MMKCPKCETELKKIIPWVYQGDGVLTFACQNKDCPVIALNMREENPDEVPTV